MHLSWLFVCRDCSHIAPGAWCVAKAQPYTCTRSAAAGEDSRKGKAILASKNHHDAFAVHGYFSDNILRLLFFIHDARMTHACNPPFWELVWEHTLRCPDSIKECGPLKREEDSMWKCTSHQKMIISCKGAHRMCGPSIAKKISVLVVLEYSFLPMNIWALWPFLPSSLYKWKTFVGFSHTLSCLQRLCRHFPYVITCTQMAVFGILAYDSLSITFLLVQNSHAMTCMKCCDVRAWNA